MTFVDTRGRLPSYLQDVEEETFTPVEAQKVARRLISSELRIEKKSSKVFQVLVGLAAYFL